MSTIKRVRINDPDHPDNDRYGWVEDTTSVTARVWLDGDDEAGTYGKEQVENQALNTIYHGTTSEDGPAAAYEIGDVVIVHGEPATVRRRVCEIDGTWRYDVTDNETGGRSTGLFERALHPSERAYCESVNGEQDNAVTGNITDLEAARYRWRFVADQLIALCDEVKRGPAPLDSAEEWWEKKDQLVNEREVHEIRANLERWADRCEAMSGRYRRAAARLRAEHDDERANRPTGALFTEDPWLNGN